MTLADQVVARFKDEVPHTINTSEKFWAMVREVDPTHTKLVPEIEGEPIFITFSDDTSIMITEDGQLFKGRKQETAQ